MGTDEDVDLALGKAGHGLPLLGGGAEARHVLDGHRVVLETLGERAVVLLGEDRGRRQHHHLLAVLGGLERGAQRHLGLAVADVAADEAVHRPRRLHVGLDELDGVALVRRLVVGEGVLEFTLPVAVHRERVALAALALGVQVEQLAGQLLSGAPRPGLDRLPARPAELGQRRMGAAGTDVAADLGQLVDGHEHPVRAGVLQVQVVTGDSGNGLGVKAGEAGDAVVLVDDDVARAQVREAAQDATAALAAWLLGGPPALEEPVIGDDREVELRGDEAALQPCRGHGDLPRGGGSALALPQPPRLEPAQVVGKALALPLAGEGEHRPVAGARELLQLGLGLLEPSRGDVGRLGAEGEGLILVDARQADTDAALQLSGDLVGRHIEVVGVLVVECRGDVLPVVGQRGSDVLGSGEEDRRVGGGQLQEGAELLHGQQFGDVRPLGGVLEGGDLGQLAMLEGELGRWGHLDAVSVVQRALGEGGEPAQRLDLVAEQVDTDGAVLGGREHVEQAAADGELATVLDLVHALVAGGDEVHGGLVEVDELTGTEDEAVRTHGRVGDLLRQSDGADHNHRRDVAGGVVPFEQGVERGDAQAHEVRRGGQVRLVVDAAARVVADDAGVQPGPQPGGEVARGAVIAGHHDRRLRRVAVQQRGDQVGPQRLGDERLAALAQKRGGLRIIIGVGEEGGEHQRLLLSV